MWPWKRKICDIKIPSNYVLRLKSNSDIWKANNRQNELCKWGGQIRLGGSNAFFVGGAPAQKEHRSSCKGPKTLNLKTSFPPPYKTYLPKRRFSDLPTNIKMSSPPTGFETDFPTLGISFKRIPADAAVLHTDILHDYGSDSITCLILNWWSPPKHGQLNGKFDLKDVSLWAKLSKWLQAVLTASGEAWMWYFAEVMVQMVLQCVTAWPLRHIQRNIQSSVASGREMLAWIPLQSVGFQYATQSILGVRMAHFQLGSFLIGLVSNCAQF